MGRSNRNIGSKSRVAARVAPTGTLAGGQSRGHGRDRRCASPVASPPSCENAATAIAVPLSGLPQKLRQLGDIRRDPPRLIALRSLAGENRGKTNGQADARPFGDIKIAML